MALKEFPREDHEGKSIQASFENFGRSELALIGSPCAVIKDLVTEILPILTKRLSVAYLDAEHQGESDANNPIMKAGAELLVTDQKDQYTFHIKEVQNHLSPKLRFGSNDLVLINGNHFIGTKQVLFLDHRKTTSLKRNLDKITNVLMVVDVDGRSSIPDFIGSQQGCDPGVPIYSRTDVQGIVKEILDWMEPRKSILNGLVLSGGLSKRMGKDKGELNYHGIAQHEYIANLLIDHCSEVRISLRGGQKINTDFETYTDAFVDMGPLGAILTAFHYQPDVAWLVLACDLPLVDNESIKRLVQARNERKMATVYKRSDKDWPEPLFAIWEPKSYSRALQMLSLGILGPGEFLINSDVSILIPANDRVLMNVNHPEERLAIFEEIQNRL